jgi:hypothetical protein
MTGFHFRKCHHSYRISPVRGQGDHSEGATKPIELQIHPNSAWIFQCRKYWSPGATPPHSPTDSIDVIAVTTPAEKEEQIAQGIAWMDPILSLFQIGRVLVSGELEV